MKLVAKKETYADQGVTKAYTSARLNSKFAFTYGRIEVKAKLPTGGGTWPAIWMLNQNINEIGAYWYEQGFGTTDWPDCGEIDIMEHWGWNQNFVQSAMHTRSSFGGTVNKGGRMLPTASTDFHVYALDWYPDRMVFSIDGLVHYTYKPDVQNQDTWPFTENQYLLLNIAIEPSIEASFTESAMEIDYVRVYQESTSAYAPSFPKPKVTLSPNPARDQLTIESAPEAEGSVLIIYDSKGRRVSEQRIRREKMQINVSSWVPGTYFVQQGQAGRIQTFTLIKK
jgi:beta-glucanase (GH16 family)